MQDKEGSLLTSWVPQQPPPSPPSPSSLPLPCALLPCRSPQPCLGRAAAGSGHSSSPVPILFWSRLRGLHWRLLFSSGLDSAPVLCPIPQGPGNLN